LREEPLVAGVELNITRRWRYLLISALVLVVDQVSKVWIANRPELGERPLVVLPGLFEIVSWHNPGALFSLLNDTPDPQRKIILTVLPVVAIGIIGFLINRASDWERYALIGFSLVLGGALGNLLDRLFRGAVVDFLYFGIGYDPLRSWLEAVFGTHHWPAFNVADSAICVGAACLVVEILRPAPPEAGAGGDGTASGQSAVRRSPGPIGGNPSGSTHG
jgi:signal peptidase II